VSRHQGGWKAGVARRVARTSWTGRSARRGPVKKRRSEWFWGFILIGVMLDVDEDDVANDGPTPTKTCARPPW
jgi:hypothetical protein